MADPKAQGAGDQEPSMEEILSSIRRIIAEDDKKEAESVAMQDSGSDVFELTEMVTDDGYVESLGQPAITAPPADVLASIDDALAPTPAPLSGQSAIDSMFDDAPAPPKPEPVMEAAPAPPPPEPERPKVEVPPMTDSNAQSDEEQLLSDQAAAASSAALKKVIPVKKAPPPGQPVIPFRDGHTVEDLIQEMLRPMMKEWLDKNLPPIVQHIVEKEIKKLTTE